MTIFENRLIGGPGLVVARKTEPPGTSFYRGFGRAGITGNVGMTGERTKRMAWQANEEKQVRR